MNDNDKILAAYKAGLARIEEDDAYHCGVVSIQTRPSDTGHRYHITVECRQVTCKRVISGRSLHGWNYDQLTMAAEFHIRELLAMVEEKHGKPVHAFTDWAGSTITMHDAPK